jgi:hypothetical protein
VGQALGLGLCLILFQVFLGTRLSGESDFATAYLKLFQYDSTWFGMIVDQGYISPPTPTPEAHGNVAFFPGYPVAARLLQNLSGWPTAVALLVTANLAAWGFWTYLLLLFQRWKVSPGLAVLGVVLIASRPGAYYLAAAYSEPLFLFGLFGFVYWSGRGTAAGYALAAAHGFVMTATRLVGLPVVLFPLLQACLHRPGAEALAGRARLLAASACGAAAALGAGLFFLYCHLRFGHWDLYMLTNEAGWKVRPNYLAFLSWRTYHLPRLLWRDGFFNQDWVNHLTVLTTLGMFAGLARLEWRRRSLPATGRRPRVAFYACAGLMFYISVAGMSSIYMNSMLRVAFPVEVLLTAALVHLLSRIRTAPGKVGAFLLGLWIVLGYFFQVGFAIRFTHGIWVA